jgi:hypothetical protein
MKFYLDTSTWGGYHDEEFAEWTVPFIEQARQGRFITVLSNVTIEELLGAPEKTRILPDSIPKDFMERVNINKEQDELAQKYIAEGALTIKQKTDAEHIAMATILKVDSLVSWNFKHMVNFFRLKQYNSINLKYGYSIIDIRTPKEVTYEEKQ